MHEQINIFTNIIPKYRISNPIRLIETFAGIGSQAKALKNLGVEFEHWKVIEFDKFAIQSYNAIHGTNFTPQDIKLTHASDLEIKERESYTYILTYSFPCQDLSLAGNQKGMAKGDNTRSGLLWEVERILDECNGHLPQVLLMENVPQVIGKNNIKDFQEWRRKLESLGYSNYVQLLNAKNYGIPQNRNRCFMVSILGNYHYTFPKKIPLKLKLKDMLEDKVDEKYYLSDKMVEYIVNDNDKWTGNNSHSYINKKIASTINTGEGQRRCDASNYVSDDYEDEIDIKGVAIKNNNSKGYAIAKAGDGIDISSRMEHHRGTVQKGMAQTIKTQCEVGVISAMLKREDLRIRKLTPKECWRLMGFSNEDFEKAKQVNSDSQLYKQAGNSIVVNVLEAIFKEMLSDES